MMFLRDVTHPVYTPHVRSGLAVSTGHRCELRSMETIYA